jgi:hypothetical protein
MPRDRGGTIEADHSKITEYYRQPRYACGQLFVGNIITSLTVNTFYNPSLWELVHQMIKAEVVMVPLPRDWEGKSYIEYFGKLLRDDDLMPVGIYRKSEAAHRSRRDYARYKKWSYVFTAPPAKETNMMKGDRVMCFSSAYRLREEDLIEEDEEEYPSEVKAIEDSAIPSMWGPSKEAPARSPQRQRSPPAA